MKKDIQPINSKGEYHGYQEVYEDNKLWFRTLGKNGLPVGYLENHINIKRTHFFIR